MNIPEFLDRMRQFARTRTDITFYPYENGHKLYARFLGRCFTLDEDEQYILTNGWLRELYSVTNGLDLGNFYIVPFNNYFNQKPEAYDQFRSSWIAGHNNPDEIVGTDFHAFMTDGNTLIGFCTGVKDADGSPFIAVANKKRRTVTDLTFIASSIDRLLDHIAKQLEEDGKLVFSVNPQDRPAQDRELCEKYETGQILEYKLRVLWDSDSALYRQHAKEDGVF